VELVRDVFKMPGERGAEVYDLGIKIFGRDGAPSENGLRTLLEATREELKLASPIAPQTVMDLSVLRDAQGDLGLTK
jgi:hypothetical protein